MTCFFTSLEMSAAELFNRVWENIDHAHFDKMHIVHAPKYTPRDSCPICNEIKKSYMHHGKSYLGAHLWQEEHRKKSVKDLHELVDNMSISIGNLKFM